METRTARLTILIDPRKKKIFEEICAAQDITPSQVVRKLIRQYVIDHAAGPDETCRQFLVHRFPVHRAVSFLGSGASAPKPNEWL